MGKIKEVTRFEQELVEHIDMLRLAREENEKYLEEVCSATPMLSIGECVLNFDNLLV
jgi:hypothetical protein